MRALKNSVWGLAAVLCALLFATPAAAQTVTTGTISGVIADAQGGVLPGATVTAVHGPTGTSYEAVTGADGRFSLLNVRVGGPYTVTVQMAGFREDKLPDIQVNLGETKELKFSLQLASVTETVEVTGQASPIDVSRAGAGANIQSDVKEALPTINRSMSDIVRLNPMFNSQGSGAGDGASAVSVAGTSFRYNSLQIDGAANNDLFGLASSAGAPGGTAETQPVSLDAIQEIQLVVSPYDVRQGGFAGGGINAITKSGTNDIHGTAFFFGRNQDWVGKGVNDRKVSTFKDKQGGFSIGGPIVKNRAFFFGTADYGRKSRPTGVSVAGSGQQFQGSEALVDRFLSILQSKYNYSPGDTPKAELTRLTNNDKYFGRADFNIAKIHQLTIRDNYINGYNDIGSPSTTFFKMPDNYYRYVSKTNSMVGQLNSTFGKGVNELRLTYTRVRDHRESPYAAAPFPQVTATIAPGVQVVAGTEQFSVRNAIDQDIFELNDAYTMLKGTHQITIGTHNEFLKLRNLFIRDNNGTYNFASLDNLEKGLAQQFDYSFSATSDPQQSANFKVNQWGFYAGDQWRTNAKFTLTYGLRVDAPQFPDKPNANPLSVQYFGYSTDVVPSGVEWSPRVGFNYDIRGNGREQIRGGVGMFTGRPAYVWISNQFANTGIDFTRIGASFNTNNKIPFVSDPSNQPKTVTGAATTPFANEIDLIDPDFKYPEILRGNVGYDRELPWWGLIGTAEFVWSKTLQDIKYQNLNFQPSATVTGVGGRPFFVKQVSSLSDVIFLQNTNKGYNWNLSYELKRPFRNGFFIDGSYSYGVARTIMDGTSDQAASNWGNVYVPGNPNDAPLARSNFDPGHRITLSGAYDIPIAKNFRTTVSLFYSGQSGRPYTLTTNRDVNGDNRGSNDLLYIPNPGELTFTGGTYDQFVSWLQGDSCLTQYIGQIIPRNACRAPWTNTLDGRVAVQLPFKRTRTEITMDILNLINLFDSKKGLVQYASFGQISNIQPVPTSVTATAPLTGYNVSTILSPTFQRFLLDDLRSRWQIQLGARVRF